MLAARQAAIAEAKALGIKMTGRKTGNKGGAASRGGTINKKEREVMGMANTFVEDDGAAAANDDKKVK